MRKIILPLFTLVMCLPLAVSQEAPPIKPGIVVTYTQYGERPNTSSVSRLEQGVAFRVEKGQTPDARLGYASRVAWRGVIQIVSPGTYTFSGNIVGGKMDVSLMKAKELFPVFESPNALNKQQKHVSKPTKLDPGVYEFIATFSITELNISQQVELFWEGPGFGKEPIPYYFLGHYESRRPKNLEGDISREHGRFLFEELSCIKCHQAPKGITLTPGLAEHTGPNLSQVSSRVYPGWLDAWLADPAKLRPHTTMPKMFTEDAQGRAERYAVVKYLNSLSTPLNDDLKMPSVKEDMQSAERGKALFTTAGCAACHANKPNAPTRKRADDDDPPVAFQPLDSVYGLGSATGVQGTYALGAVGSKTRPDKLAAYLLDPLKTNPHSRMPGMGLNAKEAQDIARHLSRTMDENLDRKNPQGTQLLPDDVAEKVLNKKPDAHFQELSADQKWSALGKVLIVNKGCVNCHDVEQNGKRLEPRLDFASSITISGRGKPDYKPKGCLSVQPGTSPQYTLSEEQRKAIGGFVRQDLNQAGPGWKQLNADSNPSFLTTARTSFKRFMCLNCHTRDGEGGLSLELAEQMKSLEKADNAENIQPPRLSGIGHKALTPWLTKVLLEGERARPWMGLRMPQYGKENLGTLPMDLASLEGTTPLTVNPSPKPEAVLLAAGRLLTGKDGYGCIACHDISGVAGGGTRGPDLALAPNRVRTEWFDRWMANPQRVSPGTQMPTYFLDGKAQNTTLNGDMLKQTHALWAYANLGPGLPLPTGLEPPKGVVIAVREKAEILRTFMPHGAGTRALAVGYPGGMNMAYDAQQARMVYAWAGNFLDASPVWTNRGGAPAKLLGPKIWDSPAGHPWVVIDEREQTLDFKKQATDPAFGASLPEGQVYQGAPRLVFEGYSVDAKGMPTFQYKHQLGKQTPLTVEETPLPMVNAVANGVSRKYEVNVSAGLTAFLRVAETENQPRLEGSKIPTELHAKDGMVILPQPGGRIVVLKANGPEGTVWLPRKPDGATTWETVLRVPTGKHTVTVNMWFLPRDDAELLKELK